MTIENYKEAKDYFTGKASEISRSLAFAGIAVIWIFRKGSEKEGIPTADVLPDEFQLPLFLFLLCLAMDLLQYAVASLIWTIFYRKTERRIDRKNIDPKKIKASRWNYRAIDTFFWLKIIFNIGAYILLLNNLIGRI